MIMVQSYACATADGRASFYDYSQVDRRRWQKQLLLYFLLLQRKPIIIGRSKIRGWITTGTVQDYFDDGIRAHMDQMATYDAASATIGCSRDDNLFNK